MLQSSGQISMSQINTELGRASNGQISLNVYSAGGVAVVQVGSGTVNINQCSASRPNTSAPTSMNEWYSYDHSASCGGGEIYPCTVNSGISYIGEGTPTIIHQSSTLVTYNGNSSYWFSTQAAAQNAHNFGGASFNPCGLFNNAGLSVLPSGTEIQIGHILINLSAPSTYRKCGFCLYYTTGGSYILALDASGQVIEKITI